MTSPIEDKKPADDGAPSDDDVPLASGSGDRAESRARPDSSVGRSTPSADSRRALAQTSCPENFEGGSAFITLGAQSAEACGPDGC